MHNTVYEIIALRDATLHILTVITQDPKQSLTLTAHPKSSDHFQW